MAYVTYQRITFPLLGVIFVASLAGCFFDGRGVGASDAFTEDLRIGDMPGSPDIAGDAEGGIFPDGAHDGAHDSALMDNSPADAPVTDGHADLVQKDVASPDVFICPPVCKGCPGGVCEIDCDIGVCTCPPKLPCRPLCGAYECRNKVDCSQATSCDVRCGYDACWGDVLCGQGDCSVTCEGLACHTKIDGSKAQKVTVTCGHNACWGDVLCGTDDCSVTCEGLACHTKVDGSSAAKTTVKCGANACWGDVLCGTGDCSVTCEGLACHAKVSCDKACACSISCPPGACWQTPKCPAACNQSCGPADGCDNC